MLMCDFVSWKGKVPICQNGKLCTMCVLGNEDNYKKLKLEQKKKEIAEGKVEEWKNF